MRGAQVRYVENRKNELIFYKRRIYSVPVGETAKKQERTAAATKHKKLISKQISTAYTGRPPTGTYIIIYNVRENTR